jgi:hypothetical protein
VVLLLEEQLLEWAGVQVQVQLQVEVQVQVEALVQPVPSVGA